MARKIVTVDGKILVKDGKIAVTDEDGECADCCEVVTHTCGGCTTNTAPDALNVAIDATGALGNPLYNGCPPLDCPCTDAGCEEFSGEYGVDYSAGDSGSGLCVWKGTYPGPGGGIPCGGSYTDNGAFDTEVTFSIYLESGNYYARLDINWASQPYTWKKNLGTSQPDCSTLFPLEFDGGDWEPTIILGDLYTFCDFTTTTITLSVA